MRVLIGCPTSIHKEYCLKEYLDGINSLTYKYFDLVLVDNSEKSKYYNKLRECGVKVIKDGYNESAKERIISSGINYHSNSNPIFINLRPKQNFCYWSINSMKNRRAFFLKGEL